MKRYEHITRLIYEAIDELNELSETNQVIERSPDSMLVGESGSLDSMGLITFCATVEESIERSYSESINLTDVILSDDHDSWTVDSLSRCIESLVECAHE